jgi:putative transposase
LASERQRCNVWNFALGRKRALGVRAPMTAPDPPNACWPLDFVHDQMTDSRRFRVPAVVDNCTRECLALVPEMSISGV